MMAWVARRARLTGRTAIRVAKRANDEQVRMWECVLSTSRAGPPTAIGPLRWVSSPDGYRLIGSYLPVQDQSETAL
jgi:hypothetical protein